MPAVSQTSTYKGYKITKHWQGWRTVDADGDTVFIGRTKSSARDGISALIRGDAWMLEELRSHGYHKI
jgi:hypothetical protein